MVCGVTRNYHKAKKGEGKGEGERRKKRRETERGQGNNIFSLYLGNRSHIIFASSQA